MVPRHNTGAPDHLTANDVRSAPEDSSAPAAAAPVAAVAPPSNRGVTGLQQAPTGASLTKSGLKRKSTPMRAGLVWSEGVKIIGDHLSNTPRVQCIWCGKEFSSCGVTRVTEHFLGGGVIKACPTDSEAFCAFKDKLSDRASAKAAAKKQKLAADAVDAEISKESLLAATSRMVKAEGGVPPPTPLPTGTKQRSLVTMLEGPRQEDELDLAVAEFAYSNNIPFAAFKSTSFKKLVKLSRCAPGHWVPPNPDKLAGPLLDTAVELLKLDQESVRSIMKKDGGTLVSDGWDDVERNHLINFLLVSGKFTIFDGTVELESGECEDAATVFKYIKQAILRAGPLSIIHVSTDTCNLMKATVWKLIAEEFPWITCSPCVPHCLNLELNDMAKKIPEVTRVLKKTRVIINRFCGRTRWPRRRLREMIMENHRRKFGLYRAKATRFAGRVREMARILRVKAELQEVVISSEYEAHVAEQRKRGRTDEDDIDSLDVETESIGTTLSIREWRVRVGEGSNPNHRAYPLLGQSSSLGRSNSTRRRLDDTHNCQKGGVADDV